MNKSAGYLFPRDFLLCDAMFHAHLRLCLAKVSGFRIYILRGHVRFGPFGKAVNYEPIAPLKMLPRNTVGKAKIKAVDHGESNVKKLRTEGVALNPSTPSITPTPPTRLRNHISRGYHQLLLAVVCAVSSISCSQAGEQSSPAQAMFPARRFSGNPIISHRGGWKDSQVMEPCIVDDPEDPNRLVMFFAGMAASVKSGVMSIGVATATKDNPFQWHENEKNPLMSPGVQGQWDDQWIRLDAVVPLGGTKFRIYYTGHGTSTGIDQIGTAVCTKQDGNWVFERDDKNPILRPSGDEKDVSQASVIAEAGRWYLHYSYRTATKTLPGIRLAVSDNGTKFIKIGDDVLSVGPEGAFDSRFIEWHQLSKINAEYVLLYEAYDGKNWSIGMACSKDPAGTFTKSTMNPVFARSGVAGSFDEVHVATPAIYHINDRWLLFYVGGNLASSHLSSYSYSHWDMGIAELHSPSVDGPKKSPDTR